jgi:hypothetical protein
VVLSAAETVEVRGAGQAATRQLLALQQGDMVVRARASTLSTLDGRPQR